MATFFPFFMFIRFPLRTVMAHSPRALSVLLFSTHSRLELGGRFLTIMMESMSTLELERRGDALSHFELKLGSVRVGALTISTKPYSFSRRGSVSVYVNKWPSINKWPYLRRAVGVASERCRHSSPIYGEFIPPNVVSARPVCFF